MKPLVAPVASGIVIAALLYGFLCAAERRLPEPEDPWLDAFTAEGMKAEFRTLSTEPQNQLLAADARVQFESPAFSGTQLRNYLVQNTSVQVVRLPGAGLAPGIAEGRKLDVRFKAQGNPVHVWRSGRTLVFVSAFGKWIPIVGQMKTAKRDVEQIFDAVEDTVKRYP
ncbi:MAG TPA: hypothetical protein VG457_19015 [Planctomycetota bacterium]|jgi:hypothetical protein|nr:hypothetical protein [Planctomycetota bacterium]